MVRFDSQKISTDTGIGTGADGNEAAQEKKTRREEIVTNQIKMKFVIFAMLAAGTPIADIGRQMTQQLVPLRLLRESKQFRKAKKAQQALTLIDERAVRLQRRDTALSGQRREGQGRDGITSSTTSCTSTPRSRRSTSTTSSTSAKSGTWSRCWRCRNATAKRA